MFEKRIKIKTDAIDESQFVLGIDLGNSTSSLSYFNVNRFEPEIMDISGGYGKKSVPTVIQFMEETREWVFGEYALLNKGFVNDITFDSLVNNLGKMMYYEVEGKAAPLSYILGLYINKLVNNIKNLNPNANILGIVAAVPNYMGEEAKTELYNAFKSSGFDKRVIDFVTDRECIFYNYCYNAEVKNERVLLLDFGGQAVRGGIYQLDADGGKININSLSSLFDEGISTEIIEAEANSLIHNYYTEKAGDGKISHQVKSQIESFTYQHKDFLFQKNQDVRLYFNFAYPPFQKTVRRDEIERLVLPFKKRMERFLIDVFDKTTSPLKPSDIGTVICTGGGFEMLWVRDLVKAAFPLSKIKTYKNSKGVISKGASIIAASRLSLIELKPIEITDEHQLKSDIGVMIREGQKERFIPIVERNSFWWQNHKDKSFIINEKTDKPVALQLFKRTEDGECFPLNELLLDGLPLRPKGTTRVNLKLRFDGYNDLKALVNDAGFGELFPATDYSKEALIKGCR